MKLDLLLVAAYLCSLPIIGLIARRQSRENSLRDYYLAGGSIALVPLIFTLYATQYSGNTLFGMAGKAYRGGPLLLFALVPGMMMAVVILRLLAKKLYQLSRENSFVTIIDFFNYRYKSSLFSQVVNFLFLLVLLSYVLSNFKAIGLLISEASEGKLTFAASVFLMATFMAIYESLGGMRGVVMTDMLQGGLLLLGCALIFTTTLSYFDGVGSFFSSLQTTWHSSESLGWYDFGLREFCFVLSIILLFSSVCVYPHAVQRIYAARSWSTLKKSLVVMTWMPLVTTLPILLTALAGHSILTPVEVGDSDGIILLIIEKLASDFPMTQVLLAGFTAMVAAAIMSTMDSALLSVNAAIINDIVRPLFPSISNRRLTISGKLFSWILLFGVATLAIVLPQSIWKLIILKLEIMIQILPAFVLGIIGTKTKTLSVGLGLVVGVIATLLLNITTHSDSSSLGWFGFHHGIVGLGFNLFVVVLVGFSTSKIQRERQRS